MRTGINTTLRTNSCCRVHSPTDQLHGVCPLCCSCALTWALGQQPPGPAQELEEPQPPPTCLFHSLPSMPWQLKTPPPQQGK